MKISSRYLLVGHNCRMVVLTVAWTIGSMMLSCCPSTAAPPTPMQVNQAQAELRIYYAWMNSAWTQDDRPYQHIRDDIDQALAKGEDSHTIFKKYQGIWSKSPDDYQTQFGYYYAAYRYANDPKTEEADVNPQILGNLFIVLVRSRHPQTYNYVRMAFLCGQYGIVDPELKTIGIRLVRRDPSDYDVKYYTIASLAQSPVPSDMALALTYAHSLVKNYPKKSSAYSIAAYVHYRSWLRTKSKREATEAISEFQKYLQLEPTRFSFRKQAERYIAQMQNE